MEGGIYGHFFILTHAVYMPSLLQLVKEQNVKSDVNMRGRIALLKIHGLDNN